jgi:hypothetical protein
VVNNINAPTYKIVKKLNILKLLTTEKSIHHTELGNLRKGHHNTQNKRTTQNDHIRHKRPICQYSNRRDFFLSSTTTVLVGDLNSKHTAWNCSSVDSNGKKLLSYCIKNNLAIHYRDQPTHYPHNSAPSVLDIAITKLCSVSKPNAPHYYPPITTPLSSNYTYTLKTCCMWTCTYKRVSCTCRCVWKCTCRCVCTGVFLFSFSLSDMC